MIDISSWQFFTLLIKVANYAAISNTIAVPFMIWLVWSCTTNTDHKNKLIFIQLCRHGLWSGFVGILISITQFFIETGAFSEAGISGMYDLEMSAIVWDSPIGSRTFYQLLAFSLAIGVNIFTLRRSTLRWRLITATLYLLIFYLFGRSFSVIGHTAELHINLQWLVSLHAFLAMLWIGSLYPLLKFCKQLPGNQLYLVMHKFGRYASALVIVLIIAGITLVYSLVDTPLELITTAYGKAIVTKIVIVAIILSLAAIHKCILVPRLLKRKNAYQKLAISIKAEIAIAAVILIITAIITTFVGPMQT